MPEVKTRLTRCHVRIPVLANQLVTNRRVFKDAHTANLSLGGAYITGDYPEDGPPDVGTRLVLQLVLPNEPQPVRAQGDVVWVNPAELDSRGQRVLGVGLTFVDLPKRDRERLERFIHQFRYQVLFVGSDGEVVHQLLDALGDDYRLLRAGSGLEAIDMLSRADAGVLIVDEDTSDISGIELLRTLEEVYPNLGAIRLLLASDPEPSVLAGWDPARRGGIFRFLRKPTAALDLRCVLNSAVETYALLRENELLSRELVKVNERLARENRHLRSKLGVGGAFENLVGQSAALIEAMTRLREVAQYPTTVHINGETGTGKELVARALHNTSPRADKPFVVINCAGIPDTLIESALFGHRKGAFTGADRDRKGLFEEANGGTAFLDEIGELPLPVQTRLLRVLQEGEVIPVGSTQPLKVDVRIVSATHRNLRQAAETEKTFREDLYYRLVVFEIDLPPVRDRAGDIPLLATHFLDMICTRFGKDVLGFTPECMAVLEGYPWPGNVRELENEMERAVIRCPASGRIDVEHLSPTVRDRSEVGRATAGASARVSAGGRSLADVVKDTELQMINDALTQCDGVAARAAELLQVEPSTLRKKMKRLGIG